MAGTRSKQRDSNKPQSKSSRCDLIFPVGRIHRCFKQGKYSASVGIGAGVFTAAVLEYITTEILELAGKAAEEQNILKIKPHHLQLTFSNDTELNKLMAITTVTTSTNVVSNLQAFLLGS